MMKKEDFDQYVRAQFASEAAAPPSHVETAVFNELAAGARRTKLIQLGLGVLVAGACSVGFYLNQESASTATPVQQPSAQVEEVKVQEVEVVVLDEQIAGDATETVVSTDQPVAAGKATEIADELFETERPERMERAGAKSMNELDAERSSQAPALQIESAETWVMPANVKVKE